MESLRQYVLSVTAAAVICGIVLNFSPKGKLQKYIRLLCGVFLSFTVMSPLSGLNVEDFLSQFTFSDTEEAKASVALGKDLSADQMAQIIKAETEAYILDKATELGADLEVEVTLSREEIPVPASVTLQGAVSGSIKQKLSHIISEDLGITKENQQWIG